MAKLTAKARNALPKSSFALPGKRAYPINDKKHAGLAKAFAAMHHDPDQAAIDAKANKILGKKKGGKIEGSAKKPHLGRPGRMKRAGGGEIYGNMPSEGDFGEGTVNPDWRRFPRPLSVGEVSPPGTPEDVLRAGAIGGASELLRQGRASNKQARPERAGGGSSDRFVLLPRSGKEPYTTALNLAGMFGGNKPTSAPSPANVPLPPPRPQNLGQTHVRTVVHNPATGQMQDLHPPIPVAGNYRGNYPIGPDLESSAFPPFGAADVSSITGYPSQHVGFGEQSSGYGEIPNGIPIPPETLRALGGRTRRK